jgi:organic hydroperoxide reductase OsmC/OhrA
MKVVVAIDATGLDRRGMEALAAWAVEHCPVSDAIVRAVPLQLEVS